MNGKHAFSVQARNNGGNPSDDLFGGTNAKLTALIATPGVPNAV
jgi:hypothetical protein